MSNLKQKYIYYVSVLFGVTMTLSFIILKNVFLKKVSIKNKEFFENAQSSNTNINDVELESNKNELLQLPHESDIYLLISTLNNGNSVSLNDLKWYNYMFDKQKLLSVQENTNMYFNMDNVVTFENNVSYHDITGVVLNKTSLKGPNAFQYSNDNDKYSVDEFTSILIFRIREIANEPLILYEIPCNTTSVVKDNVVTNVANTIAINITKKVINMQVSM